MILEEIEKILTWYKENCKTATVENLLYTRDKLACYSYDLANMVSDAFEDYNGNYFIRQISTSKKINKMVEFGTAVTQAAHKAKEEVEEVYKKELEYQSSASRLDKLLKQVNKILDSMNQRIAYLKKIHEEDSK